jgi:hypothetical protein
MYVALNADNVVATGAGDLLQINNRVCSHAHAMYTWVTMSSRLVVGVSRVPLVNGLIRGWGGWKVQRAKQISRNLRYRTPEQVLHSSVTTVSSLHASR